MPFWKKDKEKEGDSVAVSLRKVLTDISTAVQNSNFVLDRLFAEAYLSQGYERREKLQSGSCSNENPQSAEEELIPITFSLSLPSGDSDQSLRANEEEQPARHIKVPATTLLHHNSMQLDEVDLTLRFALNSREDEDLLIDLKPEQSETGSISEMKMHFKCREAPEGMARVEMRHYQGL